MPAVLCLRIGPKLKEAVDRQADLEKLPTNEWIARILAAHLGQPALAEIPRISYGRPRKNPTAVAS